MNIEFYLKSSKKIKSLQQRLEDNARQWEKIDKFWNNYQNNTPELSLTCGDVTFSMSLILTDAEEYMERFENRIENEQIQIEKEFNDLGIIFKKND